MKIPILLYHDFRPDKLDVFNIEIKSREYVLRESVFISQMRWLFENGYRGINLSIFIREYKKGRIDVCDTNDKMVVLAFDDGVRSNFSFVFPVLKKYNFAGVFFITVGLVGSHEMMTWEQIGEMHNAGMDIGSHTLTHSFPTELTVDQLKFELVESKRLLELKLESQVKFFSSPTGFYSRNLPVLARQAGYGAACFTKVAFNGVHTDLFHLNKIGIKRSFSLQLFQAIVEGDYYTLIILRIRQILRDGAKIVLGRKLYEYIKKVFLKRKLWK